MSASNSADLKKLLLAVSIIPQPWTKWPGGYPERLDLAIVDAVMSIRFRYGREQANGMWTGARGAVLRYAKHSEHVAPEHRMRYLSEQDPVALEKILNRQKVHAGKTKAHAIVEAAAGFTAIGVTEPSHLDPENPVHQAQYTNVKGLGPVTWEYLTMLVLHDGTKADTWITEFAGRALGRRVSWKLAGALVKDAAADLGMKQRELEHAIWSYASKTKLANMSPYIRAL